MEPPPTLAIRARGACVPLEGLAEPEIILLIIYKYKFVDMSNVEKLSATMNIILPVTGAIVRLLG